MEAESRWREGDGEDVRAIREGEQGGNVVEPQDLGVAEEVDGEGPLRGEWSREERREEGGEGEGGATGNQGGNGEQGQHEEGGYEPVKEEGANEEPEDREGKALWESSAAQGLREVGRISGSLHMCLMIVWDGRNLTDLWYYGRACFNAQI